MRVCLHACVRICALFKLISCDCVCSKSHRECASKCVYIICTEFCSATLIQSIVYCFYSVRNTPDVQRNVCSLHFLKQTNGKKRRCHFFQNRPHSLTAELDQASLFRSVLFLMCDYYEVINRGGNSLTRLTSEGHWWNLKGKA